MTQRIHEDALDTWRTFLEAHARVVERLERELQDERELPLTWYEVLLHLSKAPGGALRMQELGAKVLLTQSGISRLVDRMQAAGLVDRTSCPSDRRGTYATITDVGRLKLREAAPVHLRGVNERFLKHLSEDEIAGLRNALGKVVAANSG